MLCARARKTERSGQFVVVGALRRNRNALIRLVLVFLTVDWIEMDERYSLVSLV